MGYGSWDADSYRTYAYSTGRSVTSTGDLDGTYTHQDLFVSKKIDPKLIPLNVMRECNDSDEHPETVPVILALDVTGSMGSAAAEVAKKLNTVMTKLYENVKDVEFMVMAIGDLVYDRAPIQISQFEADIRVAEWLDKVYFEGGGGGNAFESYTAAWYMGLRHMMLDSWKRGKKGILITMGDEPLNPYLSAEELSKVTGDHLQGDVETKDLYRAACEKFDIYHLAVDDHATSYRYYASAVDDSWKKYLDSNHFRVVTLDNIVPQIIDIVTEATKSDRINVTNSEIAW